MHSNSSLFFACLLLAGCPTTNSSDAGNTTSDAPIATSDAPLAPDSPVAPCMPEGAYIVTVWNPDPTNSTGCASPSSTDPVRFGPNGEPLEMDGTAVVCPSACAAGDCTITNATAPTCSGALHFGMSCASGGTGDITYAFTPSGVTFGYSLTVGTNHCAYTGIGSRVAP